MIVNNFDVLNQICTIAMQLWLKFREQFLSEWRQSLHPATVTNESRENFQLWKPMKLKNIKITVWSINTISMVCLPLCLLTCHISMIHTAIFQVPSLVCNLDMRFSFRDMTTNKWQYSCYKYIRLIYETQYSMHIQRLK